MVVTWIFDGHFSIRHSLISVEGCVGLVGFSTMSCSLNSGNFSLAGNHVPYGCRRPAGLSVNVAVLAVDRGRCRSTSCRGIGGTFLSVNLSAVKIALPLTICRSKPRMQEQNEGGIAAFDFDNSQSRQQSTPIILGRAFIVRNASRCRP